MSEGIPDWAARRAVELMNEEPDVFILWPRYRDAFARYIAEHEEPPVDELLIEAREIAQETLSARGHPETGEKITTGSMDSCDAVQSALRALKRGIEMGEAK